MASTKVTYQSDLEAPHTPTGKASSLRRSWQGLRGLSLQPPIPAIGNRHKAPWCQENGRLLRACCLGNLYESIENLDASYMQSNQSKYPLLNPTTPISGSRAPLLLPKSACSSSPSTTTRHFYKCQSRSSYSSCPFYVSEDPTSVCPGCKGLMNVEASYVAAPKGSSLSSTSVGNGYVKGVVTYMVMDDLVVKPMSTISSIALLNQFNVKDLGSLQEKVVELGIEEGLELLSASMKSKRVLTDVFLSKQ